MKLILVAACNWIDLGKIGLPMICTAMIVALVSFITWIPTGSYNHSSFSGSKYLNFNGHSSLQKAVALAVVAVGRILFGVEKSVQYASFCLARCLSSGEALFF